ncbi:hypothetical protein HY989_04915 [Candidatus Micrarchaeota archaeon]|nr:hypothetical protein [Candidatus Micrarchaeota archaeon]
MNDSIKLYVVKCGSCNSKQVWDNSIKHKVCAECNSHVVMKTASPEELKGVKATIGNVPLTFSNYWVYSFSPEDVEEAVIIRKDRQKKMKEDVEDRRKFAQMEKMNYVVKASNGKLAKRPMLNDGHKKLKSKKKGK